MAGDGMQGAEQAEPGGDSCHGRVIRNQQYLYP